MREILFRAKWMLNKEWIEGYYCKISETTYAFAEDYDKYPVPVRHYILQENMTDWGPPNRFWQYEIDPETLCQYTGLKDKNGNRIWENDVVSFIDASSTDSGYWERDCDGIVTWDCECACFCVSGRLYSESWEVLEDCTVVGNIFDNPYPLMEG